MTIVGGLTGWWVFVTFVREPYSKWAEEFDLERINDLEKPSIAYDRNNQEIGRFYVENRSYVPLSEISIHMVNALIAQEDARFREHPGYDVYGIARAVKEFYNAGGSANQGASSITQQLARNAFNLKEHAIARDTSKYGRKLLEIFVAIRITERYSKDQVLEYYLNRVYLGEGYYGIRAASLGYFGKEPIDLTTREAATIAALIKNPNGLSPVKNPEQNIKWRNHVLARMAKENYITQGEADRLSKMDLGLDRKPLTRGVSHIHQRIRNDIVNLLGEERVYASGLKIYTTLDKNIHNASEEALKKQTEIIEKRHDFSHPKLKEYKKGSGERPMYLDGAVLIIDNATGAVLGYHGGRDFATRNYDCIEEGARPPGVAILPFLYATALDSGYTLAHKVNDDAIDNRLVGIGGSEGILGEWGIETERSRYEGNITLRKALSQSKIAASLRLGMEITTKPFIDELKQFGISAPIRESGTEVNPVFRPRIYVGTEPVSLKELALAYSAFANGGEKAEDIHYLDRIEDETGYVIWESPQALGNRKKTRTTSPGTAFLIHSVLQDSLKNGSAQRIAKLLPPEFDGAVKTGTNYNFADNTIVGYNSKITCAVWVGFTDNNQAIYPNAFSSDTCGPIFAETLKAALKSYPSSPIVPPSNIESVEICQLSGKRATRNCYELDPESSESSPKYIRNTYSELFRKGDMSLAGCDTHSADIADLRNIISPSADKTKTRILPIVPILPQKQALIGEDPYMTEQDSVNKLKNFELIQREGIVIEEAIPDAVEDHYELKDLSIPLPSPKPIQLPLPEF